MCDLSNSDWYAELIDRFGRGVTNLPNDDPCCAKIVSQVLDLHVVIGSSHHISIQIFWIWPSSHRNPETCKKDSYFYYCDHHLLPGDGRCKFYNCNSRIGICKENRMALPPLSIIIIWTITNIQIFLNWSYWTYYGCSTVFTAVNGFGLSASNPKRKPILIVTTFYYGVFATSRTRTQLLHTYQIFNCPGAWGLGRGEEGGYRTCGCVRKII